MTRNTDGLLVTTMLGGPSDGKTWYWAVDPPQDCIHRERHVTSSIHLYLWTGEAWQYIGVEDSNCKGK